jgi:cell division protein FtsL
MSGEDAPRPYLENLIVLEIKTNKQTVVCVLVCSLTRTWLIVGIQHALRLSTYGFNHTLEDATMFRA